LVKATKPTMPRKSIVKSFELTTNGQTIWINQIAIKHMNQYITFNRLDYRIVLLKEFKQCYLIFKMPLKKFQYKELNLIRKHIQSFRN